MLGRRRRDTCDIIANWKQSDGGSSLEGGEKQSSMFWAELMGDVGVLIGQVRVRYVRGDG